MSKDSGEMPEWCQDLSYADETSRDWGVYGWLCNLFGDRKILTVVTNCHGGEMNSYTHNWKELEVACKEMENRQPFEIKISGWCAKPAYSFFKYFDSLVNGNGKLGTALIMAPLAFLLPGLSLVAAHSRLSRYDIAFERHGKETHVLLDPAEKRSAFR